MAPQIVAAEHCEDHDVAGLPLEFECLDDGQGTKRQNCELERENGGECCWSEEAARDGTGPVVETLAQDWSSMDRESDTGTGGMESSVVLFKPRIHLFACTHPSVSNTLDCNALFAYKHQSTVICSNTFGWWFLVCVQAWVY